jgi:hypothetical protein
MSDFEVHPIGYAEEIKLSRALAREIEQTLHQWGNVIPRSVHEAYEKLNKHYQQQMERGIQ